MSPELKIDLSKYEYNGPMTVVGYPDFSAARLSFQAKTQPDKSFATTVNLNLDEHKRSQRKPHR